ncbi:hypothetical protein [Megasphaera sueciensis]|jgi:hypothetical protein|uniref:hypothetical protein n=1 Tax=Megasphaera sueciensis TaxID=349094 RepID=UPI003D093B3D|nr:hypothetical protein [Megasphaera sp.]
MSHYYIEKVFKLEEDCIKYDECLGNKAFTLRSLVKDVSVPVAIPTQTKLRITARRKSCYHWFYDAPIYAFLRK